MILFYFLFLISQFYQIHAETVPKRYNSYSEELAVDKFLPMASAAFGVTKRNVEDCIARHLDNGKLLQFINVNCPDFEEAFKKTAREDNYCAAFIALSKSEQAIILSFRGTQEVIQYKDMIVKSFYQAKADPGGKAHTYFVELTMLFEAKRLFSWVVDYMHLYPEYEIWVTGASLGGALASLGTAHLVTEHSVPEEKIKLITFGQPRTGDHEWAKAMDATIRSYKYRIVQGRDIVPHIPFIEFLPKISLGTRTHLHYFGDWLHFKGEVWYFAGANKGAPFMMCNETNENQTCSDRFFQLFPLTGTVVTNTAKNCRDNTNLQHWYYFWKWPETAYYCLEGIVTKTFTSDFEGIMTEHNTYFGIDFKGYGGKGCR